MGSLAIAPPRGSLRLRVLVLVLALVVLTGAGGGWLLFQQVRAEADAVFDAHLQEIAAVLRDEPFATGPAASVETDTVGRDLTRLEEDLVIQVFAPGGTALYLSRPEARLARPSRAGFSELVDGGERWRVYSISTPARTIEVAQPRTVREARAGRLVASLLLPFAALVALLGLALAFGLEHMLAPLGRLADGLAHAPVSGPDAASVARAIAGADDGDEAPADPSRGGRLPRLPAELHTVVSALLDLLARLDDVRTRERAFIADAAHELRTPLAALAANAQNLAARAAGTPLAADVGQLEQGVGRAARLVGQMLALSRLRAEPNDPAGAAPPADADTGAPPLTDLVARAGEAVAAIYPLAARRGVDLGLIDPAARAGDGGGPGNDGGAAADAATLAPVPVRADPHQLDVMLQNLLDNALRHSPAGTAVDIAVTPAGDGRGPRLAVIDHGEGLSDADKARAFDRFFRGANAAPGTGSGLGLAIVRAVAARAGAEVALLDTPGGGLTVTVTFPGVPPGTPRGAEPGGGPAGGGAPDARRAKA